MQTDGRFDRMTLLPASVERRARTAAAEGGHAEAAGPVPLFELLHLLLVSVCSAVWDFVFHSGRERLPALTRRDVVAERELPGCVACIETSVEGIQIQRVRGER